MHILTLIILIILHISSNPLWNKESAPISNISQINNYQWGVYNQALKVMQPFVERHKRYIVYGERVAYYKDTLGNHNEIYDFIVISEDKEIYHVYPEGLVNQHNTMNLCEGIKLNYRISPLDINFFMTWLINHEDFQTLKKKHKDLSKEALFRELFNPNNYHKNFNTENLIEEYRRIYNMDFFALFDSNGQVYGATMVTSKTLPSIIPKYLHFALICCLINAHNKDQNLKEY